MHDTTDDALSKVPEVTLTFWLIKIAATTLGETGGDTVTMTLHWGYLAGTALFLAVLAMLVAWLALIFASFGFRAPKNAITVATYVVSAVLIAGALYLILDMDVPFSGPIQISPMPLERALAELQR